MAKSLVYTFNVRGSACVKLAQKLKSDDIETVVLCSKRSIDALVKKVIENNYNKVLGLGNYRKDAKRIRIEKRFINKYGKTVISPNGSKFLYTNWNISSVDIPNSYVSNKPSNGPCNRSGYLILNAIADKNLSTQFAFLHIPKRYNVKLLIGLLAVGCKF